MYTPVDMFMLGLLGVGLVGFAGWFIAVALEARRKRELYRQIEYGEIPVDYSAAIKEIASEQNQSVLDTGFENVGRAFDLETMRHRVSIIRANGYDRATDDRYNNIEFAIGIRKNPHPFGSGAAKQWARGYCQLAGTHPKEWMERA